MRSHKQYKVRVVAIKGREMFVCSEPSEGKWRAWVEPREGTAARQAFIARTREDAERQAIEDYERGGA